MKFEGLQPSRAMREPLVRKVFRRRRHSGLSQWNDVNLNVPRLSFQEVVHPVLTEEADVAEASDFEGEPDEHAQELYALAEAVTKAAGVCLRPGSQMD